MNKVYQTSMINTGGREGQVSSPDGTFSFKVAAPGSGAEGATNPEQLFAAGYSACFGSALLLAMLRERIREESTVTATVSLYEREKQDFLIGVEIEGHIENVPLEKAQELLEKAHEICPYSKATRGNIEVTVKAV